MRRNTNVALQWRRLVSAFACDVAAGGGEPDCEYCGKGAIRKVASEPSEDVPDLAVWLETWRCQACGEIDHRIAPPR